MRTVIPAIETSDYVYVSCIGCPHAEHGSGRALGLGDVRSHFVVKAIVAALVEEIKVFGSQQGDVVTDRRCLRAGWVRAHDLFEPPVYSNPHQDSAVGYAILENRR
jgi:hypothetical protein